MPAVRSMTFGDRAFMVAAPRLPKDLRAITNVNSFKPHIKTYFLKLYSNEQFYIQFSLVCMYILLFYNALSFICFRKVIQL